MMTETEVAKLPTAVFKENAQELAGRFYTFLFSHLNIILFIILIILIIILILKIRVRSVASRAKKEKPESTNNWFSWEDFNKWAENQKK